MLELYINNFLVEGVDSEEIKITIQRSDFNDPSAIKTDWSKTVKIPSTDKNDTNLSHFYRPDLVNTRFDVFSKNTFDLRQDSERIKTGYVKFGNVTFDQYGRKQYECTLYSEEFTFFKILTETKLKDLSFLESNPYLTHQINRSFIATNWGGSESGVHEFVKYIPTLQGGYKDFDNKRLLDVDGVTRDLIFETDEWSMKSFSSYRQKPALRFKKIWQAVKAMPELAGYTFDDASFCTSQNPYYEKACVLMNSLGDGFIESKPLSAVSFAINGDNYNSVATAQTPQDVALVSGGQVSFSGASLNKAFKFTSTFSIGIDITVSNSVTYDRYFYCTDSNLGIYANQTGTILGTSNIEINNTCYFFVAANQTVGELYKDGSPVANNSYTFNVDFTTPNTTANSSFIFGEYDGVAMFDLLYDQDNQPTSVDAIDMVMNCYGRFEMQNASGVKVVSNQNVSTREFVPKELTVKDVVVEYFKLFNLNIIVKDNSVKIQTNNDYYTGAVHELIQDESRGYSIDPLFVDKAKVILGYKANDYTNFLKEYKGQVGYTYGDQVVSTNYPFDTSEKRLLDKTPFSPIQETRTQLYRPLAVGDTGTSNYLQSIKALSSYNLNGSKRDNVVLPLSVVFMPSNYTSESFVAKIFDDVAANTTENKYYYNISSTNTQAITSIPIYSTRYGSCSLDFARPQVLWYSSTEADYPLTDTIYYRWWRSILDDLYSRDTKIAKVYFLLDKATFSTINLGDFIYWKGVYWVINRIVDYSPSNASTQFELISVNDTNNYTGGQTTWL